MLKRVTKGQTDQSFKLHPMRTKSSCTSITFITYANENDELNNNIGVLINNIVNTFVQIINSTI